jgi:glutaminyl-peptide cyclotransferase
VTGRLVSFLLTLFVLASCGSTPLTFSGEEAYQQAAAQIALGPRPTGSEAGWATGDYIIERLKELGWETEEQVTEFRGVTIRNIVGRAGAGPVIIVGAHYDTRPHADLDPVNPDQSIQGANDGASGAAVLLELARALDNGALDNEIWLAFFDAEDRGNLDGWPFSVGASYMAENLTVTPQAVIVLDLVGDRDQQFYFERNSDLDLLADLWDIAADLGYQDQFIPQAKWSIIDDHAPFAALGLPAADVIDFDYPAWHTSADTLDQISAESLERIGRVMEVYLER